MSEKKKVLVFPAGTEIGFEIFNSLKYSKEIELYGGTSVPCHAEFVFKNCIEDFPDIEDKGFVPFLNKVIRKYNIDYVYPAHDKVVMKLTAEMASIPAVIVTSPLKTVKICRSKERTYNYFSDEFFIPKTYADIHNITQYPVFVKPAVGQGSEGAIRIDTQEDLLRTLKGSEKYVICEYLPGKEYTVDCFTDRYGMLRIARLRSRERIRAGIAVRSRLLPQDDIIQEIAQIINSKLKFNGGWFFQVKKNSMGEYRLLEISPRIPGTMGVSRNLGINFPLLTLYNLWGFDVDILSNENNLLLDRAFISRFETDVIYNNIYIDFDDTIVIGGKVNIFLMMFLYQAVNEGKNIYLLTKHDGDMRSILHHYKIPINIFNKIIQISVDDEKNKYITSDKSIFIDDSFTERKKIKELCGIPVYDLDMIESLIDWRM